MRLAVISDIHGNLEALEAVIADLEEQKPDRLVVCGDNVGYGPDPEAVVVRIRELGWPSVMGNHELALADSSYLRWFNAVSGRSVVEAGRLLSPDSLDFCRNLPQTIERDHHLFVHGTPPDSILTYLFELDRIELEPLFGQYSARFCFVGHTHGLELIEYHDGGVRRVELPPGDAALNSQSRYIVNVGSVGQPRDRYNRRAKYVIYDDRAEVLTVRQVRYDAQTTAEKIRAKSWPEFLAARLL